MKTTPPIMPDGVYETESGLFKKPDGQGTAWSIKIFLQPAAQNQEAVSFILGGSGESLKYLKGRVDELLKKTPQQWKGRGADAGSVRKGGTKK